MPGIAYKAQTWRAQTSPSRSYPHHFKLYATANHTQLDMLCNGQACLPLMNRFSTTSVTMHTLFLHSGYRKCESSEQAYAHLTTRRPFTDGTNVRSSNYGHTSQWRSNCAHTQAFCLTHHLPLIKKKKWHFIPAQLFLSHSTKNTIYNTVPSRLIPSPKL